MSNEIQLFKFQEHEVRTVKEEDGQVWFVAKDVCEILGIKNSRDAIKSLDDDEKMTVGLTDTQKKRGGARVLTYVNEPGLYKLIFKSKRPEAKQFTKWVTTEVLPALRKTGSYSATPKAEDKPKRELPPVEWVKAIQNAKDDEEAERLDKIYEKSTGESILEMLKPGYYEKKFDEELFRYIDEETKRQYEYELTTANEDGIVPLGALSDFENKLGIAPHEKFIWAKMAATVYPDEAEHYEGIAQIYKKEVTEQEAKE